MLSAKLSALQGRSPQILGHQDCFKAAVFLPIVEFQGNTCILFEKRSSHILNQPNEISFPGGGIEKEDASPQMAAIRETCEELNLSPGNIEVIAPLDILVSAYNAIIYPYVGYLNDYSKIIPNPDEVAEVFCVPLDFLAQYKPLASNVWINMIPADDFPFDMIPHGKDYPWRQGMVRQLFYVWDKHIIWGLTARILSNFLQLIG